MAKAKSVYLIAIAFAFPVLCCVSGIPDLHPFHATIDIEHDCHHASDSSPVHYPYIICLNQRSSLGYADVHAAATFVG
jgi:hypothetical protein